MKAFLIDNNPLTHLTLLSMRFSGSFELRHSPCTRRALKKLKSEKYDWVICSCDGLNLGDGEDLIKTLEEKNLGLIFLSKNESLLENARKTFTNPIFYFLNQNASNVYRQIQQIFELSTDLKNVV
jgi:hypothetical protein